MCIRATLINFTVTLKGLEDQLLVDVVRYERPDLEQRKDKLIISISQDKRQLKEVCRCCDWFCGCPGSSERCVQVHAAVGVWFALCVDVVMRGLRRVQIEDKILQMLADSSGDILDDEELINNLAASKATSEAIGTRMREAETTSKEINDTRELYRPVVRC